MCCLHDKKINSVEDMFSFNMKKEAIYQVCGCSMVNYG